MLTARFPHGSPCSSVLIAKQERCGSIQAEVVQRSRAYPFQDLGGFLHIANQTDAGHSTLVVDPSNTLGLEGGH